MIESRIGNKIRNEKLNNIMYNKAQITQKQRSKSEERMEKIKKIQNHLDKIKYLYKEREHDPYYLDYITKKKKNLNKKVSKNNDQTNNNVDKKKVLLNSNKDKNLNSSTEKELNKDKSSTKDKNGKELIKQILPKKKKAIIINLQVINELIIENSKGKNKDNEKENLNSKNSDKGEINHDKRF